MRRILFLLCTLFLAVSCSDEGLDPLGPGEAALAKGQNKPKLEAVFNMQLRAEHERPNPTTSEAKGPAQIKIYDNGLIEWQIQVNNKANELFFMGHIHRINNFVFQTGPIVVWLFPLAPPVAPATLADLPNLTDRHLTFRGSAVNPTIAAEILENPGLFYVNLHTRVFPGGAILGDLD